MVVVKGDADATAKTAAGVEGVLGAVAPTGEAWRRGDTAIVQVFPAKEDASSTVAAVRDAVDVGPGKVLVGGGTPGVVDFNDAVYGNFIWVILVILVVTYILLARVFRSLLLPLKAIIFNVISIGAVWGFMVFFWQKGNGSGAIFDIEPTGALTVWIPLMVFAFLYGLSMDYEVFILSRMREEYDRDGSTDRAVVAGLARTGRLVTAGSLILFLAFTALASGPETDIKVFATAPRDRHPGGRDDRAQHDAARLRLAVRPLELVHADLGRPHPARAAQQPATGEARRGAADPRPGALAQLTAPPLPGLSPGRGRRPPAAGGAGGARWPGRARPR